MVKNQDGKGYFYVTNTYDHTIELEIPVVNLTPAAVVDKQLYKEILKNTPLVSQNFGHSRSHPRIIERINDKKENEPRHVSLDKSLTDENTVLKISDKSLVMENRPFACPIDLDRPVTNPCLASSRNLVGETREKSLIKEKQKESNPCLASSRNLVVGINEKSLIKEKEKESALCPVESRNLVVGTSEKSVIKEKEKEPVQCSVEFKNVVFNQKEKINVIEPSPFTNPVKSKKVVANTSGKIKKETELIECPSEFENLKLEWSQQIDRLAEIENLVAKINVKSLIGEKKK